jgi:iron complex transport system substrate-binding protein
MEKLMKIKCVLFPFLAVLLILLAGCAKPTPSPTSAPPSIEATGVSPAPTSTVAEAPLPTEEQQPITITDALNRTVTLEGPPQRILFFGKGAIMIADALYLFPEASDRLVAVGVTTGQGESFIRVIDPAFESKVLLDHEAGPEEIAALHPDLVILKTWLADRLTAPLEELGIPVIFLSLENPDQYEAELATVGQIFQNEARSQELIQYYQEHRDRITTQVADLSDEEKPNVLIIYYSTRDAEIAFKVPPINFIQSILVQYAGGNPIWKDIEFGKSWTQVGFEQIAAWDPDQIFVTSYHADINEVMDTLKSDPKWQALQAVQEDQLYAFPVDFYSWDQPDTRWILGLNWLATRIQPDLFSDIDIDQEARDFFQEMYTMDDTSFEENILSIIKGDYP